MKDWKKEFLDDLYYFNPDLHDELSQAVGDVLRKACNETADRRLHKEKGFISEEMQIELIEPLVENWLKNCA